MLCYSIVGGARARLVSTVSELRGRGEEVPKARLVWPHNERYLWLGRRVTRCHFLSQRESLDLTDPDRLECLPVVGQGEEIVLFAVC